MRLRRTPLKEFGEAEPVTATVQKTVTSITAAPARPDDESDRDSTH